MGLSKIPRAELLTMVRHVPFIMLQLSPLRPKRPSSLSHPRRAAKPSKISDVNFTVTGVPIERRFALLVLFVGDIPHELAIAEECHRNPQAGTASRRRDTVDRALEVFSSAS